MPISNQNIIEIKKHLNKDASLYLYSDMDINNNYNKTYYVISDGYLYIFDKRIEIIDKISKNDIDSFVLESCLNYEKLYIRKDNKEKLIGCIKKEQSRYFTILVSKGIDYLNDKTIIQNEKKLSFNCPHCNRIIDPNKGYCKYCYGHSNVLIRLFNYAKKYKAIYIAMIFLFLFSALISVSITTFTNKILYNDFLNGNGKWYGQIMLFISIFLALEVLLKIVNYFYQMIIIKSTSKLSYEMKNDVFGSIEKLSYKFFFDKQTGMLMNRVVYDVEQIYQYIINAIPSFIINITKIIVLTIYLLTINYKLTLMLLLFVPIIILIFVFAYPYMHSKWEQNANKTNEMTSVLSDNLEGFREIKAFSNESKEINRFKKSSDDYKNAFISNQRIRQIVYPLIQLLMSSSIVLLWFFGGKYVIDNTLDYGDFALFIATVEMILLPLESITSFIFQDTPRIISSARRIFEIKDGKVDVIEKENAIDINDIKGNIKFENVSFGYDINTKVLDNISFEIKAGTKLGIVGKTGAGKTTIVNLLSRLYDVDNGKITIDGINIKDISLNSLHKNISVISQDIYLFNDSIFENVRYGNENAKYEDVIEACKIANVHDFIISLKDGYETIIGEKGINLSGGQRQKLAIARAILVNPKIIIFDEATSAMDTINERMIQQSINQISKNKTSIMIAHRLSTLKDVDYLIVIDNKRIIESGTMDQLSKQNGLFKELYDVQQEALKHIRIGDEYDGLSKL